jgi:uncharacterized protein YgiM (DUF1202 family)
VGLNEAVQVYAMEKNWFFIEYFVGTTTKKRGYVPYSKINNAATVAGSVPTRSFTGYADVSNQTLTVFTGPGTATVYPSPGTVYSGEGFTRFNETSGSYTYVEYSTSSGTKRGYALTSQLAGRNRGVLANVASTSTTVFTGPRDNYVTGGSVYLGEYVVILERDPSSASPAWYYIEYNSTSGRKRGYVVQSTLAPYSSVSGLSALNTIQGVSSAIQSLTVYAGPNPNFASIGSVSANEVVFTIEGVVVESSYSYIEYSTSSGQKRGYVIASSLEALSGLYATMASAATVFHGPHATNYASAGSVNLGEPVQVLGKEKSWFYIQYTASSNQKRGYVPYETLNNASTVAGSVPERSFTGYADASDQELTVFNGPANSYATSGTIYSGEGITKFNEESMDGYTYIEYSSPSGTKRGYVETVQLANRNRGILAEVTSVPATIFAGPDETYFQSGGVYLEEFVIILERDISSFYPTKWYQIEYNSPSGRKRGYVNQNCLTSSVSLDSVQELRTGTGLALALGDQTVYSGPNPNFATVGTIFVNERVSTLSGVGTESAYVYIEYSTGGQSSKRGYVRADNLQTTSVVLPSISVPNVTEGVYGYSGNSRPLKYFKIGNGSNVLATVFAVHGYEDAWAADGEELVKIAKTLIQELAAENLAAWTVYVIPYANPDGILDGWTNNGPGRTTVSAGKDINRSFPTNFHAYLQSRNYNGSTPLGSPEALDLSGILLQWKLGATTMVLLDVHGWLNESMGDSIVGQYYTNQFGFGHTALGEGARGYLTRWGQANGMLVSLIELPFPSSPQDIIDRNFAGKFVQATRNMIHGIAPSVAVTGVTISPSQVTLNYRQTQQLTATVSPANASNKAVTWSSSNPSIASVDANGLVTAGTADGTATITVTTVDGNLSAGSLVTVASPYILDLLRQLENIARTSPDVLAGYPFHTAVFDFLRHVRYGDSAWALTLFHPVRTSFVEYVQNNNSVLYNELYNYISRDALDSLVYGNTIDLAHLAATIQGYSASPFVPNFWTGWGGDLATAMANVTGLIQNGRDELDAAIEVIGNPQYSFSLTDLNADIDAIKLAELLIYPDLSIADTMDEYYQTVTAINQRDYLLKDIGFDSVPTEEDLNDALYKRMTGMQGFSLPLLGSKLYGKAIYTVPNTDPPQLIEPTDAVIRATCKAFARFILNL